MAILLTSYIIRINKVADLRYKVNVFKIGLSKENQVTQSYSDKNKENIDAIIGFARDKGMVEVKNYNSFFQESGVALSR